MIVFHTFDGEVIMNRKTFLRVVAGLVAFPAATYGLVSKLLAKINADVPSTNLQPDWMLCVSIDQDECNNCEQCVAAVGGC